MTTQRNLVWELESAANTAMPALTTRAYDGWALRFAAGYTRRANSIHPLYASNLDLDEKLRYCEEAYRAENLPVVFKLTPVHYPPNLDQALEERGYQQDAPTLVQTCELPQVPPKVAMHGANGLSQEWLEAYQTLNQVPAQHYETLQVMLMSIAHTTWYGVLHDDKGEIVALGLAVLQGSLVGIFDVIVAEHARQQGLARQLMLMLMSWGRKQGARRAYLQVTQSNIAAQALYGKLGFQTAYPYWYRTLIE
jgi:ribosomal protein S18 acetylase RimI-like enzyme